MNTKPLACWICGKVIDLSDCKVDEHGLAVHEACYVARCVTGKSSVESLGHNMRGTTTGTDPMSEAG